MKISRRLLQVEDVKFLDLENKKFLDGDLFTTLDDENMQKMLLESLEIVEELDELYYTVNVPDEEKRYSIEEQISDYLDNMLFEIKDKSSNKEKENINLEITRFIELRNLYSKLDENMNPQLPDKKGEFYKPLKETLTKLNKKTLI